MREKGRMLLLVLTLLALAPAIAFSPASWGAGNWPRLMAGPANARSCLPDPLAALPLPATSAAGQGPVVKPMRSAVPLGTAGPETDPLTGAHGDVLAPGVPQRRTFLAASARRCSPCSYATLLRGYICWAPDGTHAGW